MSGGPEVRRSGHCAKGNHYDCSGHLGCDCECHAEPGPEVRQQLAEALRDFDAATGAGIPDDELADVLLLVVERIAAERAAEALRRHHIGPVRQAALVLSDDELNDALDLWYRQREET